VTVLCVPSLEEEPWPTLGPQVCEFIESYLVHGPGDIRGEPVRLDDETRALIYRMYEVYPRDDPNAGRRRFKRVGLSSAKGTAKTEKAALIAAVELHRDGPVRCVGWGVRGDPTQPVGGPVRDPYLPMVGYTEQTTEELAFGALLVILSEGRLAGDFDIGLERIMRKGGDGKAEALATAPGAREGARTSWQHFDETWLFTLPRMVRTHRIMLANIPKRREADAWSLETTTAPEPGSGSVAEGTMDYARAVAEGRLKDSRLFFFHREASARHDVSTEKGARAAAIEARGPAAPWSDIDSIIELWRDPQTDRAHWEQVWTNRLVKGSAKAFDAMRWRELARPGVVIADGELITLGFDGARYDDATALVGTHVETGYQWLLGLWERPLGAAEWAVPEREVDAIVTAAFERWEVWRMYADPYWWEGWLASWHARWGDRVMEWRTNRLGQMAASLQDFATAIQSGELTHDGNEDLARHIGNACRRVTNLRDGEGERLYVICKERPDSPHKIDGAMAAALSWEARTDAIAAGAGQPVPWVAV